jgi:hypothetical protein
MKKYSESVWFEQVDRALLTYITELIPDIYAFVRKPEEDFKVEKYPCISIYCTGYTRNVLRYNEFHKNVAGVEKEGFYIDLEKSAVPYDLDYQIDFWTKYQSDMNDLTRIWLGNSPEGYINLPVEDAAGNKRNSFMKQDATLKRVDIVTGKDRIFHTVLTYRIWVELDEKQIKRFHYVNEVINKFENIKEMEEKR